MGKVPYGSVLAALISLSLQVLILHADDKVPYYDAGNFGEGNAEDVPVDIYSGLEMTDMISKVHVGYLLDDQKQQTLVCVGLTYGPQDDSNQCLEEKHPGSTVDVIELARNEHIIKVSGNDKFYIGKLYMETNTGTKIGPYGSLSVADSFEVYHDGAPLLYSVMKQSSIWLMEISFVFLEYAVHNLKTTCDNVASEVYGNIKSNIMGLQDTSESYKRKLYQSARMGCEIKDSKNPENNEHACNLQNILQQVDIMIQISLSHQTHTTTNLIPYSEYDSKDLLKQLQEAKDFHSLLTSMEFGAQVIINVTEQQSNQLKQYYQAQADFNKQIAEKDVAYLNGSLIRTKAGAEETANIVYDRLERIIDRCIAVVRYEEIQASFTIITQMAKMFNPFKELFGGGPDMDKLNDAASDFENAVADMQTVDVLQDTIQEYVNLQAKIADNIAKNAKQIEGMNEIVNKFDKIQDQEELEQTAKDFIQSYGDYTPALTPEDIDYMSALLNEIGAEGCDIFHGSEGILVTLDKTLSHQTADDCVHFPADQAKLDSYYQETYSLQFDLVDALTEVVRYSYSEQMADQIGSIHTEIDIEKAAIETVMLEVQVQTMAAVRCDRLQYINGGQRPAVCKHTLFSDAQVGAIISYVPSLSYSDEDRFAYFPTSLQNSAEEPFIGIEDLLRGQAQTVRLPSNNTEWLKKYQWLPGQFDEETAFYFKNVEAYVPGLRCNETNKETMKVYVKMTHGQSQKLYKQPIEPVFSIPNKMARFDYETDSSSCPGDHVTYRIMRNDTDVFDDPDAAITVCVTSKGDVPVFNRDDNTLPSLFSPWTLEIFSDEDCTLVLDPDFDFYPLVTFKMVIREVYLKTSPSDPGLDECWPEGSRCPEGLFCHNNYMSFSCEKTKQIDDEDDDDNADVDDETEDLMAKRLIDLLHQKYPSGYYKD